MFWQYRSWKWTWLLLLLLIASSLSSLTVAAAASSSNSNNNNAALRPPFVAHVTEQDLEHAIQLAQERHEMAVQDALSHFPTHTVVKDVDDTPPPQQLPLLKSYSIRAPGRLPDFHEELPRQVHVTTTPLLSKEECQQVISDSEQHFAHGPWTKLPSGQYEVQGFWIQNVPAVHDWFCRLVRQRLFPLLCKQFPDFCQHPTDLCVDNAYLFKYTSDTPRTDVHTDSGCLSFTIALNDATDYEGGGTWFDGLYEGTGDEARLLEGGILEMTRAGQVTIRPGGVKHCGHAVESGTRYIIGGFCLHQKRPEVVRQLLAQPTLGSVSAAVVLNPHLDSGYNLLAHLYETTPGYTLEQRQDVLEYCLQHVHPYSGDVAYALGSLYKNERHEPQKAMAAFEKCLQADPLDIEARVALMMTAGECHDATREEQYAQSIVQHAHVASDVALAQAYSNLGVLHANTDREMDYYQKALALQPDRYAPRYSLACAHAARQEWTEAICEFRQALLASNTSVEQTHTTLAQLYRAVRHQVQEEYQATATLTQPPSDPAQVVTRFQELMGVDNYQQLVASRQEQP